MSAVLPDNTTSVKVQPIQCPSPDTDYNAVFSGQKMPVTDQGMAGAATACASPPPTRNNSANCSPSTPAVKVESQATKTRSGRNPMRAQAANAAEEGGTLGVHEEGGTKRESSGARKAGAKDGSHNSSKKGGRAKDQAGGQRKQTSSKAGAPQTKQPRKQQAGSKDQTHGRGKRHVRNKSSLQYLSNAGSSDASIATASKQRADSKGHSKSGGSTRNSDDDSTAVGGGHAEDSDFSDSEYTIGFSQDDWDAEVRGRAVLPTGLEKTLTAQILHTYETRLCPSAESIEVKRAFIEKFATILTVEFPEWEVDIHVFGSSVNGLGTSRSDVDICLTTQHKELENVFVLNKALRKYGMRTYCVPHARVPIVKSWDPELRIASDININNTIALHNTRMIQTFVAIDARVRPFVMAIKNWTKCREINDAAFGGTLSPYAWVNLALNFFQTRSPPILPVLHPVQPPIPTDDDTINGQIDLTFNDNIDQLRGFGTANQESLGYLLYAFFRTYAYEFDYRHQVVSLRRGCYMRKEQKGWDTGRPSRIFCIEEPFSTWLNLGHSANTVSVEGIRDEFQRAFRILRDGGSYDEVCEVYQRPGKPSKPSRPSRPSASSSSLAPSASKSPHHKSSSSSNAHSVSKRMHSTGPNSTTWQPTAAQPMGKSASSAVNGDFLQFPNSYSIGYRSSPFGICHSTAASPMAMPAISSMHSSRRRESDGLITLGATTSMAANPWYATQSQLSVHQQKQELLTMHQGSPYSIIKENMLKMEQENAQLGPQLARMSVSSSNPADALGHR